MKHHRKFKGDGLKAAELLYGPIPTKTSQTELAFDKEVVDPQKETKKK